MAFAALGLRQKELMGAAFARTLERLTPGMWQEQLLGAIPGRTLARLKTEEEGE